MIGHLVAAPAILLDFHFVGMELLIAGRNVVMLSAFAAGKNHFVAFAIGHKIYPSLS